MPGTLAGFDLALREFGSLKLEEIISPAIELAEKGFTVNSELSFRIKAMASRIKAFPATAKKLMPAGNIPETNSVLQFKDLARTLKIIAREGVDTFYRGDLAKKIVDYLREKGGILSSEDLKEYQAKVTEPISVKYRGADIFTSGLANGGISVLQLLNILENFNPAEEKRESPRSINLLADSFRYAWRDRLKFFADPDFVSIDFAKFLNKNYAEKLSRDAGKKVHFLTKVSAPLTDQSTCTAHISTADAEKNMAALTMTHGNSFGSLVTVPGLGITLNHGMCRLDPVPGRANSIAPQKYVLNNMCPTIVIKGKDPLLCLGAIGGRKIITSVAQLIVNFLDFSLLPHQALYAPRCHCEDSGPLFLESHENDFITPSFADGDSDKIESWGFKKDIIPELADLGHEVKTIFRNGGPAQAIFYDKANDRLISAVDPRGDGHISYI